MSFAFFLLIAATASAQADRMFDRIKTKISEHSVYFDGIYTVTADDSILLGVSAAMTYYDPEKHAVGLCLPDYSNESFFVQYIFPADFTDIHEDIGGAFIVNTGNVFYAIDDDGEYFYVTLEFIMDGMKITYDGKFEADD